MKSYPQISCKLILTLDRGTRRVYTGFINNRKDNYDTKISEGRVQLAGRSTARAGSYDGSGKRGTSRGPIAGGGAQRTAAQALCGGIPEARQAHQKISKSEIATGGYGPRSVTQIFLIARAQARTTRLAPGHRHREERSQVPGHTHRGPGKVQKVSGLGDREAVAYNTRSKCSLDASYETHIDVGKGLLFSHRSTLTQP